MNVPAHFHESNYIHPTAVIYPGVQMGTGNYIGPYCIIGGPAEHKAKWYPDEYGNVVIGNDCQLTGHVTVDSGLEEMTRIGDYCMLMKHSHVGHDAILNADCIISCGAKIGGHTIIMHSVNIGLNAVIHQRHVIGSYSMIGMGAVVTKTALIEPGHKWVGNPAKAIGRNITFDGIQYRKEMADYKALCQIQKG